MKTGTGKDNLSKLPQAVAEYIKAFATEKRIRTFNVEYRQEGWKKYFGEGHQVWVYRAGDTASVNMVTESSVGASDVYYNIGAEVAFPAGTYIVTKQLFMGKWFLDLDVIQGPTLPSGK